MNSFRMLELLNSPIGVQFCRRIWMRARSNACISFISFGGTAFCQFASRVAERYLIKAFDKYSKISINPRCFCNHLTYAEIQDRIDYSRPIGTIGCVPYIQGYYCTEFPSSYAILAGLVTDKIASTGDLPFQKPNWLLKRPSTHWVCLDSLLRMILEQVYWSICRRFTVCRPRFCQLNQALSLPNHREDSHLAALLIWTSQEPPQWLLLRPGSELPFGPRAFPTLKDFKIPASSLLETQPQYPAVLRKDAMDSDHDTRRAPRWQLWTPVEKA